MLIKRFFRRAKTNTGFLAEEQPQPHANSFRVKKAAGKYPTLRATLISAVANSVAEEHRDRSDLKALLRVEELVEVTELALLSYCHFLFDAEVAKLRTELLTPDSE